LNGFALADGAGIVGDERRIQPGVPIALATEIDSGRPDYIDQLPGRHRGHVLTHWNDPPNDRMQQPSEPPPPWQDVTDDAQGQSFAWIGTKLQDTADE
jgi:hypothetical protein